MECSYLQFMEEDKVWDEEIYKIPDLLPPKKNTVERVLMKYGSMRKHFLDVKLDMRHIIVFKVNNRSFYTPTSFKLVGVFYCKKIEMSVLLCYNWSVFV